MLSCVCLWVVASTILKEEKKEERKENKSWMASWFWHTVQVDGSTI